MTGRDTAYTRPLQAAVAGYLLLALAIGYWSTVPSAVSNFTTGESPKGIVVLGIAFVATAITAVVSYGSIRKRTWAFFAATALFTAGFLLELRNGIPSSTGATATAVADLILVAVCLGSLIRFDPWATRRGKP